MCCQRWLRSVTHIHAHTSAQAQCPSVMTSHAQSPASARHPVRLQHESLLCCCTAIDLTLAFVISVYVLHLGFRVRLKPAALLHCSTVYLLHDQSAIDFFTANR